ncbi:hypothetical protein DES32_2914 [Methylovirgula ligni]|uniref:Uncharacterized protein n=1 Tax=Methylovirgula ligni TaxID=569860 RepID=A0A3D9YYS4_9HYPH|nr:hypothetical protein DES32_2914 [Methylovirgula ligni]
MPSGILVFESFTPKTGARFPLGTQIAVLADWFSALFVIYTIGHHSIGIPAPPRILLVSPTCTSFKHASD